MYLEDGIQQSGLNCVLDVYVIDTGENHVKEVGHVGKMDVTNCIMCFYTEKKIDMWKQKQSTAYKIVLIILKPVTTHSKQDVSIQTSSQQIEALPARRGMVNPMNRKCRHRMVILWTPEVYLPTIPVVLIKGDPTLKVDNGAIKPCVNVNMAAELEHQSQNIVSDRNCVLHLEDKAAHLMDAKEKFETPNSYGGELHRLEQQISSFSNRDFNT